jgi:polyisoprenyl-phosphate glycosyltransferase
VGLGLLRNSARETKAMNLPLVTVVVPCYNEEGNVRPLYDRLRAVFDSLPNVRFQIVFIDNASKDKTELRLRELATEDSRVKVILNIRNFGTLRSPLHAQAMLLFAWLAICRIRRN